MPYYGGDCDNHFLLSIKNVGTDIVTVSVPSIWLAVQPYRAVCMAVDS